MRKVSTDINTYHFPFLRFLNLNKPGSLFIIMMSLQRQVVLILTIYIFKLHHSTLSQIWSVTVFAIEHTDKEFCSLQDHQVNMSDASILSLSQSLDAANLPV